MKVMIESLHSGNPTLSFNDNNGDIIVLHLTDRDKELITNMHPDDHYIAFAPNSVGPNFLSDVLKKAIERFNPKKKLLDKVEKKEHEDIMDTIHNLKNEIENKAGEDVKNIDTEKGLG